jgi:hypothetical protein
VGGDGRGHDWDERVGEGQVAGAVGMVCGVHGKSMWNGSLWNVATRAHPPEPFMSRAMGDLWPHVIIPDRGKRDIKKRDGGGVGQDNGQDQGTKEGLPVDARQVRVEKRNPRRG